MERVTKQWSFVILTGSALVALSDRDLKPYAVRDPRAREVRHRICQTEFNSGQAFESDQAEHQQRHEDHQEHDQAHP